MSPRKALVAVGLVAAAAGTFGLWWTGRRTSPPPASRPPPLPANLTAVDPEIAALIGKAHDAVRAGEDDAVRWVRLGMIYDANDLDQLAVRCYEHALRLRPADAPCWYHLAVVRAELGDLDAAGSAMRHAIALDDRYPPAHWRLGFWLLDQGQVAEAEAAFRSALRIDPGDAAARIGMGRAYLQRGAYREAAEVLEAVVEAGTENAGHARLLLARAYRHLGRLEEADATARSSMDAGPAWRDPRRRQVSALRSGFATRMVRAKELLDRGQPDQARVLLERLRSQRPNEASILTNLGIAYRLLGRLDGSIETLREALASHPDHYPAHFELALAYAMKARHPDIRDPEALREEAMAHLDRALALNPTLARAHVLKGGLLVARNDLEGASKAFREAARCDPQNPQWLYRAALAHTRMTEWDRAAEALQAVTRQAPTWGEAFHLLGVAELNRGQWRAAEASLRRAKTLLPDDRRMDEALAELERRKAEN